MDNNLDLTVIIPVHSVSDENFDGLLDMALNSIVKNSIKPKEIIISRCSCKDVEERLNNLDVNKYSDLNIKIVENDLGKTFQEQLNYNALNIKTKYFSFLEFDDEFSINWFKNVLKYINSYPEVDMFLPIVSNVDKSNTFAGYTNEAAWAYNFSNELGYIDNDTLMEYHNISLDGMVVKTDSYNEVGGLKESMKLTFNYEFLLRFTNQNKSLMVIPKIGYKHVNMRPGSLFWEYKNSESLDVKIEPKEAHFWMQTAKEEYHFINDRNIKYESIES